MATTRCRGARVRSARVWENLHRHDAGAAGRPGAAPIGVSYRYCQKALRDRRRAAAPRAGAAAGPPAPIRAIEGTRSRPACPPTRLSSFQPGEPPSIAVDPRQVRESGNGRTCSSLLQAETMCRQREPRQEPAPPLSASGQNAISGTSARRLEPGAVRDDPQRTKARWRPGRPRPAERRLGRGVAHRRSNEFCEGGRERWPAYVSQRRSCGSGQRPGGGVTAPSA